VDAAPPAGARPAPRPPAWVATGAVFFSLAAAKRSVYLLPLHPAVALLLGAGVAAPPANGRLERLARLGALLFAPAGLGLAALGGALVLGFDPVPLVQPWLRPDDAAGAATLAAAVRAAAPWLALLAGATAAATPLVARAAARAEWRRLVLAVAALFALWTASFDMLLHPAIARERSLKGFLAEVSRSVPPGAPLYALYPPDPGLRFYAPAALRAWPHRGVAAGARLLLWEDEWQRLRDPSGQTLTVLAVSAARQPGRGRLALVAAPVGPLVRAPDTAVPPPLEVRTGSRSR